MADWTLLPREIIVMVFRSINDNKDLISASSVCHVWRDAYRDPCLWRTRTFEFSGLRLSYDANLRYLDEYSMRFGHYLQHLQISCIAPNLINASKIARCVHRLLVNLFVISPRATLKSITIKNLHFEHTWGGFRRSKYMLLKTFDDIFKLNHHLKHVDFSYDQLSWKHARQVTMAMTRSRSAGKLETLNLHDFYSPFAPQRQIPNECKSVFELCQNLSVVSINYDYLDEASLKCACQNLRLTLKRIHLLVSHHNRFNHCIRNRLGRDVWRSATDRCPKLLVSLTLNYWPLDPTVFLVEFTPLDQFTLCGGYKSSPSFRFLKLLNHLTALFSSSLTKTVFKVEEKEEETLTSRDSLKEALSNFLVKCSRLRYVEFSEALVPHTCIKEIKRSQIFDQSRNVSIRVS